MTRLCLLLLFVLCICFTGCKAQSDRGANENASPETVISATPPFQTKEPDRYRATRVFTLTVAEGQTFLTKTSIARAGDMRRYEYDRGPKRVAYLDVPEGKFLLLLDDKVYADLAGEPDASVNEEEITPERLLHSDTGTTSYQKLGTEVIGGRNANKYRVVVNSPDTGNVSVSETLIWIDEALHMPIRSETTSSAGTRTATELTDIALDVDNGIFKVPGGYEKIAFSEFSKRLARKD